MLKKMLMLGFIVCLAAGGKAEERQNPKPLPKTLVLDTMIDGGMSGGLYVGTGLVQLEVTIFGNSHTTVELQTDSVQILHGNFSLPGDSRSYGWSYMPVMAFPFREIVRNKLTVYTNGSMDNLPPPEKLIEAAARDLEKQINGTVAILVNENGEKQKDLSESIKKLQIQIDKLSAEMQTSFLPSEIIQKHYASLREQRSALEIEKAGLEAEKTLLLKKIADVKPDDEMLKKADRLNNAIWDIEDQQQELKSNASKKNAFVSLNEIPGYKGNARRLQELRLELSAIKAATQDKRPGELNQKLQDVELRLESIRAKVDRLLDDLGDYSQMMQNIAGKQTEMVKKRREIDNLNRQIEVMQKCLAEVEAEWLTLRPLKIEYGSVITADSDLYTPEGKTVPPEKRTRHRVGAGSGEDAAKGSGMF